MTLIQAKSRISLIHEPDTNVRSNAPSPHAPRCTHDGMHAEPTLSLSRSDGSGWRLRMVVRAKADTRRRAAADGGAQLQTASA
mmetsp:Transcript_1622/g.4567  ORF Transcript_1622/g.4567 Transcript_1622/m.4567 type:complete len:83 (+) Transcript_1622:146-394(+)